MDNSTKCISETDPPVYLRPAGCGFVTCDFLREKANTQYEAIADQSDPQSEIQMDDEIQMDGNEPMMDGDEQTETDLRRLLGSLSTKDCLKVRDGVSPCWITAPRGFNARTADPFNEYNFDIDPASKITQDIRTLLEAKIQEIDRVWAEQNSLAELNAQTKPRDHFASRNKNLHGRILAAEGAAELHMIAYHALLALDELRSHADTKHGLTSRSRIGASLSGLRSWFSKAVGKTSSGQGAKK